MSRLTYRHADGSWGLKGVDWKTLVALPPQVYGALAKLKDMENQVDEINAASEDLDGSAELALVHLMTMGSVSTATGQSRAKSWLMNRFCKQS